MEYGATSSLQGHVHMSSRKIKIGMNAGEGWWFLAVDTDLHLLNAVIVLLLSSLSSMIHF